MSLVRHGYPDGTHLSLLLQRIEFIQPMALYSPVRPVEVHLEQVDAVDPQLPERNFRLSGDVAFWKAGLHILWHSPLLHGPDAFRFRGDEGRFPRPTLESLSDDRLGLAIVAGGIEEVDPLVPTIVHRSDGFGLIEAPEDPFQAKSPEAELRHLSLCFWK